MDKYPSTKSLGALISSVKCEVCSVDHALWSLYCKLHTMTI